MKFDVLTGEPVVDVTLADKSETDLRISMLGNGPTIRLMLKDTNHPVELHADGYRYVKGLKCTHSECGADWNTLDNHPAMRFVTPPTEAHYPGNPCTLHCTACSGPIVRAPDLFRALYPTRQAKNLDKFSVCYLHLRDFIAVRADGKIACGEASFQEGAKLVAPRQPNLETDFEALLIRAPSLSVAKDAIGREVFPFEAFKSVSVTHDLWPRARWHNQPMNATDTAGIAADAKRQRREAAASAEAEVQALRDEIAQRPRV
jgi:hypothetical protein